MNIRLNLKPRRWTTAAIECYERHCVCDGCPVKKTIETSCEMKSSVLALVRDFGLPQKLFSDLFADIKPEENDIINAILNGANTVQEIADKSQKTEHTVKIHLKNLFLQAENKGIIFNGQNKLSQFENYVRNELKGELMYDKDLDLEYSNYFSPMVDAVKKGYITINEIAKITEQKPSTLSVHFDNFFKFLVKSELIDNKSDKPKRIAVIDFISGRLMDKNLPMPRVTRKPVFPDDFALKKEQKTIKLYSENEYNKLEQENENLKKRIEELESNTTKIDFCKIKQQIAEKIALLQQKLKALEMLETEFEFEKKG